MVGGAAPGGPVTLAEAADKVGHAPGQLSPTGVFALLFVALYIDWIRLGPDAIRDRIAFLLGVVAIRVGWDGSPIDQWTVGQLSDWIDAVKHTGNAYVGAAATADIIGILVSGLGVYCLGVLAPSRCSRWAGPWATAAFGGGGRAGKGGGGRLGSVLRLNPRLWLCALGLGMFADLSGGAIGSVLEFLITTTERVASPLPNWLFGV